MEDRSHPFGFDFEKTYDWPVYEKNNYSGEQK